MLQNAFCTTSSFISTFTAKANLIYKTAMFHLIIRTFRSLFLKRGGSEREWSTLVGLRKGEKEKIIIFAV